MSLPFKRAGRSWTALPLSLSLSVTPPAAASQSGQFQTSRNATFHLAFLDGRFNGRSILSRTSPRNERSLPPLQRAASLCDSRPPHWSVYTTYGMKKASAALVWTLDWAWAVENWKHGTCDLPVTGNCKSHRSPYFCLVAVCLYNFLLVSSFVFRIFCVGAWVACLQYELFTWSKLDVFINLFEFWMIDFSHACPAQRSTVLYPLCYPVITLGYHQPPQLGHLSHCPTTSMLISHLSDYHSCRWVPEYLSCPSFHMFLILSRSLLRQDL